MTGDAHPKLSVVQHGLIRTEDVRRCRHVLYAGDSLRIRVRLGCPDRLNDLRLRGRGNEPLHQCLRGIFENTGRVPVAVANNHAARDVFRVLIYSRNLECDRIRERHVSVQALEDYGPVGCDVVDELPGRQLRRSPILVVPVAARNPPAYRLSSGESSECVPELSLTVRMAQLRAGQVCSTRVKMHMGVIEARKHASAAEVYLWNVLRLSAQNFFGCAHLDDAVPRNSDGFGLRLTRISRPDLSVDENQGQSTLSAGAHSSSE